MRIIFFVILLIFTSLFSVTAQEKVIYAGNLISKSGTGTVLEIEKIPTNFSKLVIDVKCSLANKCLFLPMGSELCFVGKGYIDEGEIRGNHSKLSVQTDSSVIGLDILISGIWCNTQVYDSWFDFNNSPLYVSNHIIKNILNLTNDDCFCHITFQADRTYYFELPYKGDTHIGDRIPYSKVNGKKKREYAELYKDKYAYLRIFTIPSNTHLTIDNNFQMLPTNQGIYFVFWEYKKANVTIDGKGCISGDARVHLYNSPFIKGSNYFGEWGHIFCCKACSNFSFKDITIQNSFGDCIVYTADYSNPQISERTSQRLLIDGVKIKYARRNGVTIGAKDALIQNTTFESCGIDSIYGTDPRAGIDFEPDGVRIYPETGNENVYMKSCFFRNNKYDISSTFNNLPNFGKVATHIVDCEFTAPLRLNTTNWIEFDNCIIPDITNFQNRITQQCPVRNIRFKRCIIKRMPIILFTSTWNNQFLQTKIVEKY